MAIKGRDDLHFVERQATGIVEKLQDRLLPLQKFQNSPLGLLYCYGPEILRRWETEFRRWLQHPDQNTFPEIEFVATPVCVRGPRPGFLPDSQVGSTLKFRCARHSLGLQLSAFGRLVGNASSVAPNLPRTRSEICTNCVLNSDNDRAVDTRPKMTLSLDLPGFPLKFASQSLSAAKIATGS
jgi:hypothetical protein